jgi:hypothetical protein
MGTGASNHEACLVSCSAVFHKLMSVYKHDFHTNLFTMTTNGTGTETLELK